MNKFDMFKDAVTDVRRFAERVDDEKTAPLSHAVSNSIRTKPKFYVPVALARSGNAALGEYANLIRLPYPEMAIMTEVVILDDEGTKTETTAIFLVHEARPEAAEKNPERAYHIIAVTYLPDGTGGTNIRWSISPYIVMLHVNDSAHTVMASGRFLTPAIKEQCRELLEGSKWVGQGFDDMVAKDASYDALIVARMLIYMNLHGVEHKKCARPAPKKTTRAAKLREHAMYDYHVLKIGGEVWDSLHTSTGTGPGKRSHLRRGHLRRRWGRVVWVRETYVHGSVEGYVEKDYEVAT